MVTARDIKISVKLTLSHACSSLHLQNKKVTGVLELQKDLYTGCGLVFQNDFFRKLMKKLKKVLTVIIHNSSVN